MKKVTTKLYREVTAEQVYLHIRINPGLTGEAIRFEFEASPARVRYILRKLRDGKFIRGKGNTRAMTYRVTAKVMK